MTASEMEVVREEIAFMECACAAGQKVSVLRLNLDDKLAAQQLQLRQQLENIEILRDLLRHAWERCNGLRRGGSDGR